MTNGWHDKFAKRLLRVEVMLYVAILLGVIDIVSGVF